MLLFIIIIRINMKEKLCFLITKSSLRPLESVEKVFFSNISRQDASDFSPQTQRKKDMVIPYITENYKFFFLLLCVLCASAPLREPLFRVFSTESLRLYLRFYGVINFEIIPLELMIREGL